MVQVLEDNSFGSQFGRSLGQLGGQMAGNALQGHMQQKAAAQKSKQFSDAIMQNYGIDISGYPIETQQEFAKQFAKTAAQEQLLKHVAPGLFGDKKDMGQDLTKGDSSGQHAQSQNMDFGNLGEEELMGLSAVSPALGKQATKNKEIGQKEKHFGHSSTEKYANELRESAANAEEIKFANGVLRNAMKSGKTGATGQNLAYAYLTDIKSPLAGMFQSKEAGQFNVGMKTLASGFKKIMGAKPTEREFFWYENILPGLLKGAPTNEAIIDYFDHLADLQLKSQEVSDDIVKNNQGTRPIDIDRQVREQMKPYVNQAINEGFALSGEFESSGKKGKGKEKTSEKTIFTEAPPATKANEGKILTNEDTGEKFKSNGTEWVPLNG